MFIVATSVDPALLNDPTVSAIYEPGSVIKAFTVAAGVDAGVIDADTFGQGFGPFGRLADRFLVSAIKGGIVHGLLQS